ncbi:Zinc finger CCCH-type with G patch domain-containing protein [Geodia barretti]|uniref:Zinc finger CCCH-type with G patch domain-containing protein n=2 Tax=Geodia barretti TaxID=519541 RepID=A0AA35XFU3_GEOBA|nr:Zinc finger CCCH-type with G patch domain-containing protein [Geodia barretti]
MVINAMQAWGAVNYHNAVVLCRENSDSEEPEKVRVLFTHPTYNAMKPCPFFLDGKCRFESSVCKFSHGTVVPFSQLLAYQDPDYSLISTGGKCLAKYSDGLWYQAIISSFDEEFTVHIPSLNKTVQTPIENVFPLEGSESGSSSDDEDLDEEGEGEEGAVVEWIPSGPHRALGDWEKYTTGIGSKLMAKMGYVVGKGLGKSGEGRVEPVEIKILPPGKSLDMCAEMREEGKLRKAPGQEKEGRRRRRRKRRLVETSRIEEEKRVNVFDFLNAKLQKKDSQAKSQSVSKPKSGNLNVQLFTVQEDIKSVGKRRQSLQAQFARHKGRRVEIIYLCILG